MKNARMSVLVLSYNNVEYFKECIDSVLCQSYSNIELVVGDDCSKEFPLSAIKKYISKNKNTNIKNIIFYQNNKNIGVVKNYKKAIDTATGEYIFYLAIDDMFYDENVLENVVNFFEETEFDIFTGYRETFDNFGNCKIQPTLKDAQLFSTRNIEKKLNRLIRTAIVMGCCTPFKKSLVEKYGFGEEKYIHLEDWPRYLYLLENNVDIGFLDKILIKYRTGGITGEIKNEDLIKDFATLYSKYMFAPYSVMFDSIRNRKTIIGWGTANNFTRSYEKFVEITGKELNFLVDGSGLKQGENVLGYTIESPELIKGFDKKNIFVVIFCTGYYQEIAEYLEALGYIEGIDFDVFIEARGCYVDCTNQIKR